LSRASHGRSQIVARGSGNRQVDTSRKQYSLS
jgi:hypothetical protein